MQYKIPVQIENEDPILLWLSLKQLIIIMVWWGISYWIFKSLEPSVWWEIAAIPTIVTFWITLLIALFKQYEMTFIPFVLALLRLNINYKERIWKSWVDSFNCLQIWTIYNTENTKEKEIDFKTKQEKINSIDDKINKL